MKNEIFPIIELLENLLLFHSYSRQETSMLSPEGLPMPNSVVYCKNKQGEKEKYKDKLKSYFLKTNKYMNN